MSFHPGRLFVAYPVIARERLPVIGFAPHDPHGDRLREGIAGEALVIVLMEVGASQTDRRRHGCHLLDFTLPEPLPRCSWRLLFMLFADGTFFAEGLNKGRNCLALIHQ